MNIPNKSRLLLSLLLSTIMFFVPAAFAGNAAGAASATSPGLSLGPGPDPTLAELAQQKAAVLVNDLGATSVQYAVISDGQIILSGNAGVYSRTVDTPITSDTVYGIGSTSKAFTTAAIMILVDRGQVELDAPVTKYIPEFTMADPRYRQITVRMLLNHSSGLMGSSLRSAFLYNDPDQMAHDLLIADLASQRLKAAPGEFSVYCNDGFTLAELVVERVSGESFTNFIRHNITAPLGMTNTATPQDDFDFNRLARTYVDEVGGHAAVDTLGVIGTGGIYSTAEDLCKFAMIFMDDPGSASAGTMLSVQSRAAMAAKEYEAGIWPKQEHSIFGYGLGWDAVNTYPFDCYGIKAISKGGDTQLNHSNLLVLPQVNLAAAIVSSGGSSTTNLIMATELLQRVLESMGTLTAATKPEAPSDKPVAAAMPPTLLGYSGLYGSASSFARVDIAADGLLTIAALGDDAPPAETLVYVGDGVFAAVNGGKQVNFVTESNGHTYARRVVYVDLPGLGHTVITDYYMQKLAPVALEESVLRAWSARDGISYYPVNEKFSSQAYAIPDAMIRISLSKEEPGYVGTLQIVDANTAISPLQIPVMAGRDLMDFVLYEEDGKEYVKVSNMIALSEKNIDVLPTEGAVACTIGADGYAVWYHIASTDAGKTIHVKVPEHGSFAIYEDHACTEFSWISGHDTATLPANGMIVFAGDPGAMFEMSFGPAK